MLFYGSIRTTVNPKPFSRDTGRGLKTSSDLPLFRAHGPGFSGGYGLRVQGLGD